VVVQLFAANGAAVGDLEIADEHMPFAAIGAPAAKATGHCLLCWALLFVRGGCLCLNAGLHGRLLRR
jgi:hypothetical protein